VLLCGQGGEPKFDVQGHRYLRYGSIQELEKLGHEIRELLAASARR
jgi:hypothetical protein